MDIVYSQGQVTAAEVASGLGNTQSDSTVRTLLRILEQKGFLKHREEGPRYVYLPTESHQTASRSAIKQVLNTFFKGSIANAVAALIDTSESKLSPEELERIESLVRSAKNKSPKL